MHGNYSAYAVSFESGKVSLVIAVHGGNWAKSFDLSSIVLPRDVGATDRLLQCFYLLPLDFLGPRVLRQDDGFDGNVDGFEGFAGALCGRWAVTE